MQHRVNSFSGFQPLKEVWLGDCYPVEFYSHLSAEVQDAFAVITEWTQQDLAVIQRTLESLGVVVRRPEFTDRAEDYMINDVLLKPPICPRDNSMTLGNEFYHLRSEYPRDPWQAQLNDFAAQGVTIHQQADGPLACLHPPSIVRLGRDIYVDYDTHAHVWDFVAPMLTAWARDHRVHVCQTGGHSDAVFCPVAPGRIVATHHLTQYHSTFPNWAVFDIPRQNGYFGQWHVDHHAVQGNHGFAQHIDQYAQHWVGNVQETVFEANMLVINPTTVMAIRPHPGLDRWLAGQGIQAIYCDFRCRSFWDGGLHCLTTDIVRLGSAEDYFPERPDANYLDWL
jgi:hypothetical protein